MKPQQLARMLNIAPTTLRRWAGEEYAEYLSPSGKGVNGAHRSYSEQDARVLAWVAVMRAENLSPKEILMALHAARADGWQNLPPMPGGMAMDEPIAVMPREAAQERLQAIQDQFRVELEAAHKERDILLAQNTELRVENKELQHQLRVITERILTLLEQEQAVRRTKR